MRRTQAQTEQLNEDLELGVLWDEYGLDGDSVVSVFLRILFPHPDDCS
jgi:hypothetical protein